ncbi:sigma 54-interacting transcriptional regulator [Bacteriovoracales bacterium]|nr:sigma 54-interacting transcriptional regulator [Bacteriovoracales bacterium]
MDDFNFLHNSFNSETNPKFLLNKRSTKENEKRNINLFFIGEKKQRLEKRNFKIVGNWSLSYFHYDDVESFLEISLPNELLIIILDCPKKDFKNQINKLKTLIKSNMKLDLIVINRDYSIQEIAYGMKKGIYQFIEPSFKEKDFINLILGIISKKLKESEEKDYIKEENQKKKFNGVIGKDKFLIEHFKSIEGNCGVNYFLILGEKGVGKKKLVELLHNESTFFEGPISHLNINAVPKSILNETIFGNLSIKKRGIIQTSNKGSLCVDYFENIDLITQEKIDFYIRENKLDLNIFIISRDNQEEIMEKLCLEIREKLKNNIIRQSLLKNRREDLETFINFFVEKYKKINRRYFFFSEDALDSLLNYDWPGNITELENLIEKLSVTFDKDKILLEDLPFDLIRNELPRKRIPYIDIGQEGFCLSEVIKEIEKSIIEQALIKTDGNKNQASKLLKINRTTLIEKMKKRNIENKFPN